MKDKISFLIISFACCILIASSERECMRTQHGHLRPDANDCSKYYRCEYYIKDNMNTHEFFWKNEECPPYEYFDWAVSNCIPNYGVCEDALITPYTHCFNDEKQLDPGNEKQYFKCRNGTWTVKECPFNLIYDENSNECTKVCKATTVKHDPNDCTKYFLCKNEEEWVSMNCKSEMYFNRELKSCEYDKKNLCEKTIHTTVEPILTTKKTFIPEKCIESTIKPDLHDCARYFKCKNGTWLLKTCSENQYFDIFFLECHTDYDGHCAKQHEEKKLLSASQCSDGKVVPNSGNCLSYYICNNGTYIPKICKNNTYFNKDELKCIKEDGTCRETKIPLIKMSTTRKVLWKNCTENDSKPDPVNCERYIECINNIWVPKQCTFNSHYNSTAKTCVFGSCKNEILNEKDREIGSIGCTNGAVKSDPYDCINYYLCKNDKWHLSKCAKNMYYNEDKMKCVLNDGSCKENPFPFDTKKLQIDSCKDGETKPDIFDCRQYYVCRKNVWTVALCFEKMYYNIEKKYCILNDGTCKVNKENNIKKNKNCKEGETKRDIFDCNRYYLCKNDMWTASICGKNKYYNQEKKHCIIDNGICDKNLKSITTDNKNKKIVEIKDSSKIETLCKLGEFKEDKISCNRYYYCRNTEWQLFQCPESYYFNIEQKYCLPNIENCKPTIAESKEPECTESKYKLNLKVPATYYECVNTKWTLKHCNTGYSFDLISGKCEKLTSRVDEIQNETKKNETIKINECTDGEHKPNGDSKMTYYACMDSEWKLKSCLSGMIYDPDSTVCLPDMNAKKAPIKV